MATEGYTGSVDLISGIRPKNSGTFPLVDAHDVYVSAPDVRLDEVLAGGVASMQSVTWADLKSSRDAGLLVPGRQYRITDYVATVANDGNAQSANHPFDIIVTADATDRLNERARAVMHEKTVLDFAEDVHYAVGDFCKYEGIVYRCITAHQGEWNEDDFTEESPYFYNCDLAAWDVWYCIDNDTGRFAWADATNGKGVIFRLVDEFSNDCPYDFKGIQFKAYGDTDGVWRYTFDDGETYGNADLSLDGFDGRSLVYGNTILPKTSIVTSSLSSSYRQGLNCLVFKGVDCYSNTFGPNCYSNTFGSNCYFNTFGSNCHFNTFGDGCFLNTFGSNCSASTFGNDCRFNMFGNSCSFNTFGNDCRYNTFGASGYLITFGNGCYHNTVGNGCYYIRFGDAENVKSYCHNIRVGSGNGAIYINPTGTTSFYVPYRNVEIKEGVNNGDTEDITWKTISDPNVGQTFLTTYKPANSQEISI